MKRVETFSPKEIEKMQRGAESYANKVGIRLNPDRKIVEGVINGLLKNKKNHGAVYCPCRVITGNKKKDREIVCPCVFHRGEIELKGLCLCHLFAAPINKSNS